MACSACPDYSSGQTNIQQEIEIEDELDDDLDDMEDNVNDNTDQDFEDLQKWYVDEWFMKDILPNMMKMAEQLSVVALEQVKIIGAFLDAKQQLETQRLLQQLSARAYKDYQPSEGICTIVTMTRSLAATEPHVAVASTVMAQRAIDRQLRNINASSDRGEESDRASRYDSFRKRYCDKHDNFGTLGDGSGTQGAICAHDASVPADTLNKDIDYYRTVGKASNLDMDFTNATPTDTEKDVFALDSNLYGHIVPQNIESSQLKDNKDKAEAYLDVRSIVAKRSVAEYSFQTITAMKTVGGVSAAMKTVDYMTAALEELGISNLDAKIILGENPSYYTQMEVLTKKIFQRPEFFVDLYDKPANVERKSVALQAISLMQRRDIFNSALRTESMLSVLLELDLMKAQGEVEDRMGGVKK